MTDLLNEPNDSSSSHKAPVLVPEKGPLPVSSVAGRSGVADLLRVEHDIPEEAAKASDLRDSADRAALRSGSSHSSSPEKLPTMTSPSVASATASRAAAKQDKSYTPSWDMCSPVSPGSPGLDPVEHARDALHAVVDQVLVELHQDTSAEFSRLRARIRELEERLLEVQLERQTARAEASSLRDQTALLSRRVQQLESHLSSLPGPPPPASSTFNSGSLASSSSVSSTNWWSGGRLARIAGSVVETLTQTNDQQAPHSSGSHLSGVSLPRLTSEKARVLTRLRNSLGTEFDPKGTPRHAERLGELWNALFPESPPPAQLLHDPQWVRAGFRSPEPSNDLKGVGLLGLQNLLFFAQGHAQEVRVMMRRQQTYPLAMTGCNITLMLVQECELTGAVVEKKSTEGQWKVRDTLIVLLQEEMAFAKVYCLALLYFDHLWLAQHAVFSDYSRILAGTRSAVVEALMKRPQSLPELQALLKL